MLSARQVMFQLVSVALIFTGMTQTVAAGVVGSNDLISAEERGERITKIEALMAQENVAQELQKFGVAPEDVAQRVQSLTNAELLQLEQTIDEQIAGAGVVGLIGAVFVVLMILELVGVTDIFKSF